VERPSEVSDPPRFSFLNEIVENAVADEPFGKIFNPADSDSVKKIVIDITGS
jgi:hypothetical protein